jgi:hypothetical protein
MCREKKRCRAAEQSLVLREVRPCGKLLGELGDYKRFEHVRQRWTVASRASVLEEQTW